MFEVIILGSDQSTYNGDNWLRALTAYHTAANKGEHVVLWEGEQPAREYHPELGHLDIN